MSHAAGNSDRDRVLDATDLVALIGEHVQLRPKGREHIGLCPFHDDRAPSMTVVTHKGAGFYKCFSCGAAGTALDFMMNYHKMEFIDALRALAERAGIELRQTRGDEGPTGGRRALLRANAIAAAYFRKVLAHPELGRAARQALDQRAISPAAREHHALGAAPDSWDAFVMHLDRLRAHHLGTAGARGDDAVPELDVFRAAGLVRDGRQGPIDGFRNRVIFPICDELGSPIAFGARQINPEDQPKYLNSPESGIFHKGRGLYGIHLAKKRIIETKTAVICEGYTDVIACHAAGATNAVATLGTALTRDHARVLKRMCERVILLFDGDAAGQKAADRAVEVFFSEPIDVRICTLPDELDPDELLRQPGGRQRFDAALEASQDALSYFVRRFRSDFRGAAGLSAQQQRIEAVLARLVELGFQGMSGIRRTLVMSSLSSITGLTEANLEEALKAIRAPAVRTRPDRDEGGPDSSDSAEDDPRNRPLEEQGFSASNARGRREAERGLVALLSAHPALAQVRVPLEDGCTLPIAEALTPESLLDPLTRSIYEVVHAWLESGHQFKSSELMSELRDADARSLACDLVMTGERRAPSGKQSTEQLLDAFAAFERIRRPRSGVGTPSAVSNDPQALSARLEEVRARGRDPTAFARLARTASTQRTPVHVARPNPPTSASPAPNASLPT